MLKLWPVRGGTVTISALLFVVVVLQAALGFYKLPSPSMRPGLVVGDYILVNKFSYGIRIPIVNNVLIPVGKPQHGDVMVFNYPENPSINYIKRVIGVSGDTVTYRNKRLTVNGQRVKTDAAGEHMYFEQSVQPVINRQFTETLGSHTYQTLEVPRQPAFDLSKVADFPYRENCRYDEDGFTCKVPEGHYFMLGDNRDHSADGRYWGFVPDKYVVGKAFFVWLNIKQPGRIGTTIR
ncbi:signal peptidase I [Formivibrio citricus]|uniref:Signal peptidase I n=1 Tax=Formivibrio citricus TaxID=83765 RepID=A0A1I4WFW6_9NEIS|nr:signal peptidase I [Formivibrio citricus]SFN12315.1 signal peptidase I [Formivibrio citricus]